MKTCSSIFAFLSVLALGFGFPSTAGAQNTPLTIMPLGDSGTIGSDYYTVTAGGYRDPLYHDLIASGLTNFTFVGVNNDTNIFGSASRALIEANQTSNNGFGGYEIIDLYNNLDGNVAAVDSLTGNQGGYWITGGNGTGRAPEHPNIILLEAGANDILQGASASTVEASLQSLVVKLHTLTPSSVIFVAAIYPFSEAPNSSQNTVIQAYDTYIQNTLVPSLSYTRYVDNHTAFFNSDGTVNSLLLGTDDVHPTRYGYPVWAENWAQALRTYLSLAPTSYTLTVSGGTIVNGATTTGSFPPGSVITLNSSTPPSGDQFGSWSTTVGTRALSNPYWQIVTYLTPAANSTVTATDTTSGSPVIPDGTYNIVGGSDEYQMSFSTGPNGFSMGAASVQPGSLVQEQIYTGAATQQWVVKNINPATNTVEMSLPANGPALEVVGASTATNANLDVATYSGAASQQWTLTPLLGTTEIVNVNSGQAAAYGYNSSNGSLLVQDGAGYAPYQTWAFYAATNVPPVAPTGLTATAGSGQVSLSWTASPGATSYDVYRGTAGGGLPNLAVIATNVTSTSYVDQALTGPPGVPMGLTATAGAGEVFLNWSATNSNTTYYYEVVAVDATGTSSAGSNDANAAPSGGPAVTSYNIYRGTAPYQESQTPYAVGVASNSYTDTNVTAGTPYYYYIAAVSLTGTSSGSGQVTATPNAAAAPATLSSAVSRQVHGSAGTFDLPLPLTGTPAIECREGSTPGNYSIVLTFSQPVQSLTATLGVQSGQTKALTGAAQTPVISGNTVTVSLTGVGDAQRLNLHLSAIVPGSGTADVPLNILWGDVNSNGLVSTSDVNIVRAASGATVTAQNYLDDVNVNGLLSTSDVNIVRTLSGTSLP